MNTLNWGQMLLPLPYTKTFTLEEVEQRTFCSISFNRQVTSTLDNANLTLSKDIYAFELNSDDVGILRVKELEGYIVNAQKSSFESFEEEATFNLGANSSIAFDIGEGNYSIESQSKGNYVYHIVDSSSDLVMTGISEAIVEIEYKGTWLSFHNPGDWVLKFKVTRL